MGVLCQEMENKIPMLCAQLSVFAGRVPQTYNHVITANNTVFTEDTTVRASWLQVFQLSLPRFFGVRVFLTGFSISANRELKSRVWDSRPYALLPYCPQTQNFNCPLTQVIRRSLVPVPKVSAKATAQAELNQECSKGGKDKGKGKEPGQRQALGPCRHGAQPEGQQGQEGHGHGQGQGQGPRAQGQRPALGPYRHGAQPGGQQGQGEQLEAVRKVTTETLASGVQV